MNVSTFLQMSVNLRCTFPKSWWNLSRFVEEYQIFPRIDFIRFKPNYQLQKYTSTINIIFDRFCLLFVIWVYDKHRKTPKFSFCPVFWKSGCSNVRNPPAEKAQHVLNLKDFLDMLELLVIKLTVHTQNLTKWFETIRCPYGCNTRKVVRTFSQEEKKEEV